MPYWYLAFRGNREGYWSFGVLRMKGRWPVKATSHSYSHEKLGSRRESDYGGFQKMQIGKRTSESFLIGAALLEGGTWQLNIFWGPEFLKRPSQVSWIKNQAAINTLVQYLIDRAELVNNSNNWVFLTDLLPAFHCLPHYFRLSLAKKPWYKSLVFIRCLYPAWLKPPCNFLSSDQRTPFVNNETGTKPVSPIRSLHLQLYGFFVQLASIFIWYKR